MESVNNQPPASASRFKNKRIWLERVEKFISPIYFADVNLYSKLYPKKKTVCLRHDQSITRFEKYDAVLKKFMSGDATSIKVGQTFGPTWSTHWFQAKFDIPHHWLGAEIRFRWNSESEAMVWKDGVALQGLTGGDGQTRTDFIVTKKALTSESKTLHIEMAANGMFGAGKDGMINPPDLKRTFTLSMAEVATFNREAYNIIRDLNILVGMVKELPEDCQRAWQALYAGNDVVNCFQPETDDSYKRAFQILDIFFKQKNGDSQHKVHAVGHCHIDTAWLWPYEESIRKCARSWSSALTLMKSYPKFTFACSQAQQYEWVETHYPALYKEIRTFVMKGQFIPVGGTWVEMDGNLPSGESFVRQFLFGQKFFLSQFGKKCSVLWLPDTFGYSAQLPQIMKECGIKYFLSQKLSWNLINKFPHSTFLWQGIDGTRCLTHFPPADTYESSAGVDDILKSSCKNKDMGRVNDSMLLFGYGDGGGGPTEDMLETLHRLEDVDGVPRVELSTPDKIFKELEKSTAKLSVWVGELYLELHQGTLTTNGKIKLNNRICEVQLQKAEFLSTIAWIKGQKEPELYPTAELARVWKLVLLNQFHDVLPGTSISKVYKDASRHHQDVLNTVESLKKSAVLSLQCNNKQMAEKNTKKRPGFLNACSWERKEVIRIYNDEYCETALENAVKNANGDIIYQKANDFCNNFVFIDAPAMGFGCPTPIPSSVSHARIEVIGDDISMSNGIIHAIFDKVGRVISLNLAGSKREVIAKNSFGNQLVVHDDVPLFWDAWDVMPYYKETRKPLTESTSFEIIEEGPLLVGFRVRIDISSDSYIIQEISLSANSPYVCVVNWASWYENRKILRVEFPVDVHSSFATYEIQFGHVQRPTHANTSWDWAKYEVCGHKWIDLSEHDFGVSLLSDCKYGYATTGNTMSISLLRSPKSPDISTDMGVHMFSYAIMPHQGSFQSAGVVQQSYNFVHSIRILERTIFDYNASFIEQQLLELPDDLISKSFFVVSAPAVIMETVKKAEEIENAIVVRLYEAYGGRCTTNFKSILPIKGVSRCNMLEEPFSSEDSDDFSWDENDGCEVDFKPFEIITLMLRLK